MGYEPGDQRRMPEALRRELEYTAMRPHAEGDTAVQQLRLIQLGIDHPHGPLYRETIAHHDGIALVGGYDPDPTRARSILTREGIEIPLFDDMHAAISACRPDAALITLPNDDTPPAIVMAAEHGVHIFAEKPCAVSATAFAESRDAVRSAGVSFVPAYLRRFSPVAIGLRDLIADGVLGDLLSAQVTFATSNVELRNAAYLSGRTIEEVRETGMQLDGGSTGERHWLFERARSGGGVLHWLGVHWLDLLRMLTGEELDCTSATLTTRSSLPIDVEDVASVALRSSTGMIATVTCGYVLPSGADQTQIAIQGTDGWVTWDGSSPEFVIESRHPMWSTDPRRTVRFDIDSKPGYAGALGWAALDLFRATVLHGTPLPVGVGDATAVLELLDAIHREAG